MVNENQDTGQDHRQDTINKLEHEATQFIRSVRTELTGVIDQLGDDVARNVKKVEQKPLITFASIFVGGCMAGMFLSRNLRSTGSSNGSKTISPSSRATKVA